MSSLRFETQAPVVSPHPNRTDIACFVGYVGRRETAITPELDRWLRERGWHFYTFIGTDGARFMCSWDTTDLAIDALLEDARDLSAAESR